LDAAVAVAAGSGDGNAKAGAAPARRSSLFAAQQWQEKQAKSAKRKGLERAATQKALEKFKETDVKRKTEMRKTEAGDAAHVPVRKKQSGFLCCGGGEDDVKDPSMVPPTTPPREKTKEEKEVDRVIEIIRKKGRTYEEGTVVLSFDELCTELVKDEFPGVPSPTPQCAALIATLLRARLSGDVEYMLEEEEDEEEDDRADEDKALKRGKDEAVIITAQKAASLKPGERQRLEHAPPPLFTSDKPPGSRHLLGASRLITQARSRSGGAAA